MTCKQHIIYINLCICNAYTHIYISHMSKHMSNVGHMCSHVWCLCTVDLPTYVYVSHWPPMNKFLLQWWALWNFIVIPAFRKQRSGVQGCLQLCRAFEASLDYKEDLSQKEKKSSYKYVFLQMCTTSTYHICVPGQAVLHTESVQCPELLSGSCL